MESGTLKLGTRSFAFGIVCWLLLVGLGFFVIEGYAIAPGKRSESLSTWPEGSALQHDIALPTLLFFAHPRCPCSRSSFEELSRALAKISKAVSPTVVFTVPEGADAGWTETELFLLIAFTVSPLTWSGEISSLSIHVWTAIILGGTIALFPCFW